MPVSSPVGEIVRAALRKMSVAVQAVQMRVDATMIQFIVRAELVATNNERLRRIRRVLDVWFVDGTDGDNGLVIYGQPEWEAESVTFLDGTDGDNGLEITAPITAGDEVVFFTEDAYSQAWAIRNTEFVQLRDFSIQYVLDFLRAEQVVFSDISVAWQGIVQPLDALTVTDSVTFTGGGVIGAADSFTISEVMQGGPAVIFGDAVALFEVWGTEPQFPPIAETIFFVETKMVVSEVAATDARPGAFIPGSALLGSST